MVMGAIMASQIRKISTTGTTGLRHIAHRTLVVSPTGTGRRARHVGTRPWPGSPAAGLPHLHTPRAARPVRQNEQTGLLNDVSRDAAPAPRARPAWVLPALQGVIQAILLVPVTLSFSAIIFKHPCYAPYLPALSRLVLASSLVHQACFALWSGLPFAVGQVQDAGLIFLSAIASQVAPSALVFTLSVRAASARGESRRGAGKKSSTRETSNQEPSMTNNSADLTVPHMQAYVDSDGHTSFTQAKL